MTPEQESRYQVLLEMPVKNISKEEIEEFKTLFYMWIEREKEKELSCERPCNPNLGCPYCEEYWERMTREGFWDPTKMEWTDKGMQEMSKG